LPICLPRLETTAINYGKALPSFPATTVTLPCFHRRNIEMAVINTNIAAVRATFASNSANKMLGISMQRLSTGKRINGANDDAAGLGIVTTMTASIRGMNMAVRNTNDGISLAQTADGVLSEVVNMVQRVRELAVQSASETYVASDRQAMQEEVSALTEQIADTLANSTFNGKTLFSTTAGTDVTFDLQIGSTTTDVMTITSKAIDGTNLDATALDVTTVALARTTLDNADAALDDINAARSTLGAAQNRLESVANNLTTNVTSLSDARSRIEDTDYSTETPAMAKAQILSQASTAMIAQANQSAQNVMSLLR
jgi:flagellin